MFTFINSLLGIILFVLTSVIIVKKILIGSKCIDSGWIFLVIMALGLVGLLCAISVLLGASSINEQLSQSSIDKAMLIETIGIDEFIARQKTINIIYLIIGYATLISEYVIYKILKRKYKQEQSKIKNHWDLNKLS